MIHWRFGWSDSSRWPGHWGCQLGFPHSDNRLGGSPPQRVRCKLVPELHYGSDRVTRSFAATMTDACVSSTRLYQVAARGATPVVSD